MKLFDEHIPFWKGNLHTHTTLSDGWVDPDEVIRRFKQHGYDFVAITDHRKNYPGYQGREDILVVPSAEYDRNFISEAPEHAFHITGVGLTEEIPVEASMTAQDFVNAIKRQKAFCTLCHPAWSLMSVQECMDLQNYDAVEIYNTTSEIYAGRGFSDLYVDMMASRGRFPLLTAVDDCHRYDRDAFGGYVMVQAKERTWPALYEALMAGKFYASQGPSIDQIMREGDHIHVTTSDCVSIAFMTNRLYDGERITYAPGVKEEGWRMGDTSSVIHEAEYTMKGSDRFVRVEVRDAFGKAAWSNFIVR